MGEVFEVVQVPGDLDALVRFLCADEWPFHGRTTLTPEAVVAIDFSSPDVTSYWAMDGAERVALIRLLELDDIGDGAPQFDLRVPARHRGRGVGSRAVRWLVGHVFDTYPEAHRIEANTRGDNVAMQKVLTKAGFKLEGRLREAWRSGDEWFDTLVYGILRADVT